MSLDQKIKDIEFQKQKLIVEEKLALDEAIKNGTSEDIVKAQNYWQAKQREQAMDEGVGRSLLVDPNAKYAQQGYVEKNFNVSFQVLRQMSKTPIPRAIIGTRREQVAEFCTPQRDKYSPGFIIRKKNRNYFGKDDDNEPTKEEIKEINRLTDFVLNCGDNQNKWHADDFESFMRKITTDSLSLDQYTYEIIRNRKGEINEFVATDGATFRVADTYDDDDVKGGQKPPKINGYYPSYVQVYHARPVAEFYPWELCFGVRNPQSDIMSNAYGRSELEDLISTVTSLLNADQYNSNYFKIGSNPKGLLRVKGLNPSRLEEFRSQWMAEMAGVNNAHKMPVIDAEKMEFISTQQSNKDMEYGRYYEFLVKIACAIFTISPEEIGFPLEGVGASNLGGKGNNETELEYSRSKGLFPLLRNLEKNLNKYIVGPASNDKYELVWMGLRERTAEAELDMQVKEVQYVKTVNEVRKERGLEEVENGDIILNPVFMQNKQAGMFGDAESNMFMDEADEAEKSESENNPFVNSLQSFVDEEFK